MDRTRTIDILPNPQNITLRIARPASLEKAMARARNAARRIVAFFLLNRTFLPCYLVVSGAFGAPSHPK
jgi:hypothetical protein